MKALSLRPEWAMPVMLGEKTVEVRTWRTDYRGQLLICSSNRPIAGAIAGHAFCIVELLDVVPFTHEHLEVSLLGEMPDRQCYAWMLGDVEWIEPFPVKGRLGLYDVDDTLIHVIPYTVSNGDALRRYYEPLMKWSDRYTSEAETRKWWNDLLRQSFQMFW